MTAADRPPVTPRVGDIVEDPVDLERLPVGSVVLGRDGRAYDHRGYDMWHRSERLGGTVGEYIVPARVLYVPGEQPGSSTDQALAEAWAEGHRTGWEHCQDGNYGNDHWDDPTPNPYAAAARAETTTATPPGLTVSEDGSVLNWQGVNYVPQRAERTTDATEDAALDAATEAVEAEFTSINAGSDHGARDVAEAAVYAFLGARGLLATARTRPTRDDISDAIEHSGIAIGTSDAEQAADRAHPVRAGGCGHGAGRRSR